MHSWAEKTTSQRVATYPDEDALIIATGFLGANRTPKTDAAIGKISFVALGDVVDVELYHPFRMFHGVVPQHPQGMPMQGLLSVRRDYEDTASLTHLGPDGELYRPGSEPGLVALNPMDQMSKLATLTYFQTRIDAAIDTH